MMTDEEKLSRLLNMTFDTIEEHYEQFSSKDVREMSTQLLASIALAMVLKNMGMWRFLRTVFGALRVPSMLSKDALIIE